MPKNGNGTKKNQKNRKNKTVKFNPIAFANNGNMRTTEKNVPFATKYTTKNTTPGSALGYITPQEHAEAKQWYLWMNTPAYTPGPYNRKNRKSMAALASALPEKYFNAEALRALSAGPAVAGWGGAAAEGGAAAAAGGAGYSNSEYDPYL